MKELIIEVDTKEPEKISKLVEHIQFQSFNNPRFDKEGIKFKMVKKNLLCGDLKCMNLGAERKEITDFAASIKDGRFIKQMEKMRDNYEFRYVLVSGSFQRVNRDQDRRAILTSCTSAIVNYGVHVQFLPNDEYLVHYFLMLCMKHSKELKPLTNFIAPERPKEHDAIITVMGTHGIGKAMALNLLKDNDTVQNIFNASKEQLMKTYRVGEVLAEKILATGTTRFGEENSNEKREEGNRENQKQVKRTNYSRPTRQHKSKSSNRTKYKPPIRQTKSKGRRNTAITHKGTKTTKTPNRR